MNALTQSLPVQETAVSASTVIPVHNFPSLHAMGLRLGAIDADHLTTDAALVVARGKKKQTLEAQFNALERERLQIEQMVEAGEPQTVGDAIVCQTVAMAQVMSLCIPDNLPIGESREARLTRAHRQLMAGLSCIAKIHGVDLAAIAGEYYLAPWTPDSATEIASSTQANFQHPAEAAADAELEGVMYFSGFLA